MKCIVLLNKSLPGDHLSTPDDDDGSDRFSELIAAHPKDCLQGFSTICVESNRSPLDEFEMDSYHRIASATSASVMSIFS